MPKFEEPKREEVDAIELHELVVKEEGSTSAELNEMRKVVEKTFPEMILWGEVQEKFEKSGNDKPKRL